MFYLRKVKRRPHCHGHINFHWRNFPFENSTMSSLDDYFILFYFFRARRKSDTSLGSMRRPRVILVAKYIIEFFLLWMWSWKRGQREGIVKGVTSRGIFFSPLSRMCRDWNLRYIFFDVPHSDFFFTFRCIFFPLFNTD